MYTKTGRQHCRSDATIRSKNNEDAEKKKLKQAVKQHK
jgi:hypothetical protein